MQIDFDHLVRIDFVMVSNPKLALTDMKEVLTPARGKPGALKFSSSVIVIANSPAQFVLQINADSAKWGKIVTEGNIKGQ